jgi:hypothetical protein
MSVLNLPRPEPQMRLVTVDPDLANKWLTNHNTHNRHLAPSRVGLYAQTMSKGLWRHPTGEPLIFDRLGRLQDGQHRLAAQVKAGQTITYWVMTDADPDDFLVIDQGRSRTSGDIIGMEGIPHRNQVAAIARTVLMIERAPDRAWSGGIVHRVLPSEVTEFARANHELLVPAAQRGGLAAKLARIPATPFGAIDFCVESQVAGSGQWADFAEGVIHGVGLTPGSPILALRRWGLTRSTMQGVSQQLQVAIITKAWNAFVEGREIQRLSWSTAQLPLPRPKTPAA